jgi:hypothetical protein
MIDTPLHGVFYKKSEYLAESEFQMQVDHGWRARLHTSPTELCSALIQKMSECKSSQWDLLDIYLGSKLYSLSSKYS